MLSILALSMYWKGSLDNTFMLWTDFMKTFHLRLILKNITYAKMIHTQTNSLLINEAIKSSRYGKLWLEISLEAYGNICLEIHLFHQTKAYTHDEHEGAKSFATSKSSHSNIKIWNLNVTKQKKSSESQISSSWTKCQQMHAKCQIVPSD